ncbi:MAG: hypoxanthine phosphoribosyltransferase [Phycisphaerales bacterium]|jgi:hypoxanthine phosphoribosyltransferase|nr:hypoxanthine phosphoribosyltransferase [Phycisphaerales bacterium]
MQADIDRILITRQQIAERVRELALRITADHSPPILDAGEITIVPILTGAVIFTADLIRHMPLAMKIGLITVSSYPGAAVQSKGAQLLGRQLGDIRGRHVLVVDDILDSGGTLRMVVPLLQQYGPAGVKTCVLLRKDRPAARDVPVDYVGFDIPDQFVVGYGLDYDDYYRNLPEIVTLRPSAMGKSP